MQTAPSVSDRSTSFSAVDDEGTPPSLKAFGGAYIFLWLGMLALIYVARRRQLALKAKLADAERSFHARS
jgi:hypothetical protein